MKVKNKKNKIIKLFKKILIIINIISGLNLNIIYLIDEYDDLIDEYSKDYKKNIDENNDDEENNDEENNDYFEKKLMYYILWLLISLGWGYIGIDILCHIILDVLAHLPQNLPMHDPVAVTYIIVNILIHIYPNHATQLMYYTFNLWIWDNILKLLKPNNKDDEDDEDDEE